MSGRIKAKDLSYDKSLPPFLQRLHDQHAGRPNADRHEHPIPRPTRLKNADEDDGPTVVDESGETVTQDQLTELNESAQLDASKTETGLPETSSVPDKNTESGEPAIERESAKVTDGTARRKRKVAKVVGEDSAADELEVPRKKAATKSKKPKPIKLTFDDND